MHLGPNALLTEDKQALEDLKSERNFFFGKLCDLEVLCYEQEVLAFVQRVLDALYATENGFAVLDNDYLGGQPDNDEN